jgi:hypothetical protein
MLWTLVGDLHLNTSVIDKGDFDMVEYYSTVVYGTGNAKRTVRLSITHETS